MTRDELKGLLADTTNEDFVDRHIFAGTPWIFDSPTTYDAWLSSISSELELEPQYIRIVGSAATGYSLSPLKPGRPFRPRTATTTSSDMSLEGFRTQVDQAKKKTNTKKFPAEVHAYAEAVTRAATDLGRREERLQIVERRIHRALKRS